MNGLDFFSIALGLMAGLALFLLGVDHLAQGFRSADDERVRGVLARFTTNRYAGVGTGIVATTVLDSSSVTIVMVVTMVHAGLMTFVQALGVVLGANIGTTIGSQIIAFQVHHYAPVALVAGLLLGYVGRSERALKAGRLLLGAGLLLFGLSYLGASMAPLKGHQPIVDWLAALGTTPILGVLAGCAFTLVIQSSSATVGMAIVMAMQGLLPLSAGIAIMLGAEIGTVATVLIACVGRSREAVRVALFHLLFNVTTVVLGLVFLGPLTALAQGLTPGGSVARHLANAHVAFNVLGVALFVGVLPWIARALERLVPPASKPTAATPPGARVEDDATGRPESLVPA